jgi:predicted DNA-binding transcriptional regulator AlpA
LPTCEDALVETNNSLQPAHRLLTARECAQLLQLDERTLRRMRKAGRFPEPLRFGRAIRWKAQVVEFWLESLASTPPTTLEPPGVLPVAIRPPSHKT